MSITKAVAANPQGDTTAYGGTARSLDPRTGLLPAATSPASAIGAATWTLPAIDPGGNETLAVAIPGVQPGDAIAVGIDPASLPPGVAVLANILEAGTVTLNAVNNGASTSAAATVPVAVEVWSAGMIAAEESQHLRSV